MGGTVIGGKLAAKTNKHVYGEDFYARIGALGGAVKGHKGFYFNRELAREAGRKGGLKSRRGPAKDKLFVVDDKPFAAGFNAPSLKDRFKSKLKGQRNG